MKKSSYTKSILLLLIIIGLASCDTKKSAESDSDNLTDLKDFPKEWVLIGNAGDFEIASDSVPVAQAILMNSDSSFFGQIAIKQNGDIWQMINSGVVNVPDTYSIIRCKRNIEGNAGEMVYYNFELQAEGDTTTVKLLVNFRHNPENPQSSVFFYTGPEDMTWNVEMIEKPWADRFPKTTLEYGG